MTDVLETQTTTQPSPQPGDFAAGWWAGGLTLAERRALSGPPRPAPDSEERADRRLARWREEHRLGESGQFDRRLSEIGLAESDLRALLAESRDSLASRATRPEWAEFIEAVVAHIPVEREVPEPAGDEPVAWRAGFSVIVTPFVELAYERLATAVGSHGLDGLVDPIELRGSFANALGPHLVTIAGRTLVLELNVMRVREMLTGDTPQHRFWSFVRHFARRAGLVALFEEYPVLARLLAQASTLAVESWVELLHRFATDRPRIVADIFGGADPGRVVEVSTGRGDSHQRGRSVALLRFDGGSRVVYKPRPLAAHVHFNECVDWFNERLPDFQLRTLTVLDRAAYGWVEFADHKPCADRAGLERYYRRQGGLLALLYALEGSDFHFENLIASGDQPVLVDLEALLHPELPVAGPELLSGDPARAAQDASVSRVGLLPALVFGEGGSAIDLSGVGGDAGRQLPFKAPDWAEAGTDEMRLIREHPVFPGSQNQPQLADVEVDPSEFLPALMAGFRVGYDAIAAHREDLVASSGLVRRFAADDFRLVARATRVYAILMQESTHPDVMRDALDRDRILDFLWAMSKDDPWRERLVEHELRDLWAGDIPLFSTRSNADDVWTADGARLVGMVTNGIDRATRKIRAMDAADRGVQEWIIQASFASRRATTPGVREQEDSTHPVPTPVPLSHRDDPVDPERALAAARAVGDRLAETAYREGDRVGWLGLTFLEESRWLVQPLGFEMYGGYPGVALFLSQLAERTGEERYAELARRTLYPLRQLVDEVADHPTEAGLQCGAFQIPVGLAYVTVHAAANLGEPELLSSVEPLLTAVTPGVATDELLDVIGGSAGCLVASLGIHEATGLPAALTLARACADRLVETAKPQEEGGVAWESTMESSRPLTGFSHGTAGVGWALLKYARATGEMKYAEVGLDAFRYERALYHQGIGNWPDYRVLHGVPERGPDELPKSMHAWCHGAPGVGLSRADCGFTDHPEVAADLDLAMRSMLASHDPDPNLSICHGQLGNLELLNVAATGSAERAVRGWRALETFDQLGPLCGTPGWIPTPGLMVGLAGVGHGLLRLGYPDRVPSVLLLQPPRTR